MQRVFSLDGGSGDKGGPRWCLSGFLGTFHFGWTFSPCSTQESCSSQPPAFAALRIEVTTSIQSADLRAANMAVHVPLWRYVRVNTWTRQTKRKDHFKPPTLTIYYGFKDRASKKKKNKNSLTPPHIQPNKCKKKKKKKRQLHLRMQRGLWRTQTCLHLNWTERTSNNIQNSYVFVHIY